MKNNSSIDELVQSVSLNIPRPVLFYGYVFPFIILYSVWWYGWLFVYGFAEYSEAGFLGTSVIALVQLLCCLTCHWSVHVNVWMTCRSAKSPAEAKAVKVVPTANNGSSELVTLHSFKKDTETIYYFLFQKIKYVWDNEKKRFKGVEFPVTNSFKFYMQSKGPEDDAEVKRLEREYGSNQMDMVVPQFMELLQERATAPFFVFQVLCVALWCLDKYWYYSIFTLIMLILFECTLVHQQIRNMDEILKMGNKPYKINAYRNRKWTEILSDQLIPGDIVSITRSKTDFLVPCDMLLLRGSCIVDESMLTGESVPQMKEPIESVDIEKNLDIESDGKLHVLCGGTKVVQHTPPSKTSTGLRAKDNGCVGYVLRTGFNTSQGKLLRTILFGVKRVTANNLETFGFILFLLIFAIIAASYVWIKGCEDPKRNRYKLFLECTLILTSVVPPELPIELSLAVNTSLLSLSKLYVFCTEPFRIPFAGKVDICCFDKTGTLTSDNLVVEGLAGLGKGDNGVIPLSEAPPESIQVLATCHSLVQLNDGIVGDPLEKATLVAVDWNLTRGEAVIPKSGRAPGLKIYHRHYFSSSLKRMTVVAGYLEQGSTEVVYIATVKGAPETLKSMFVNVPEDYDETYLEMSRRGARVLALGWRHLGRISPQQAREFTREQLETELKFVGFVVISCPLKADSKSVIKEILNASHAVTMITGDNPLTACHVARELKFTRKTATILLEKSEDGAWFWQSINKVVELPVDAQPNKYRDLVAKYDLCLTGEGLQYLVDNNKKYLDNILPYVKVFARVAPKQKELVITLLKSLGYCTLMCGDGTNDVGALKHADVGVAIISNAPENEAEWAGSAELRRKQEEARERERQRVQLMAREKEISNATKERILEELKSPQDVQVVKLGDASIAAPFTSKLSSIRCICHIIKQGRCTLVTTLQMFKILALNALILAYSQSVLYLDGIKFSDFQATLQGLLLAACFLFISRSKPLKTLSRQRPLPNIFNLYTIMTVMLQFMVHFGCLIYLVQQATPAKSDSSPLTGDKNDTSTDSGTVSPLDKDENEEDDPFQANLINSTVYIISMVFQISTFAINYGGHPFMESLWENKHLRMSIFGAAGVVACLALGIFPPLNQMFEIIEFETEFRIMLVQVLVADFVLSLIMDRVCYRLLGQGSLKSGR